MKQPNGMLNLLSKKKIVKDGDELKNQSISTQIVQWIEKMNNFGGFYNEVSHFKKSN